MDELKKIDPATTCARSTSRRTTTARSTRRHAAHHRRHRRLLLDGLAQALPREEVRDPDPGRRGDAGGVRHRRPASPRSSTRFARGQRADRRSGTWPTRPRPATYYQRRARRASASRPACFKEERYHPLAAGGRDRGRVPRRARAPRRVINLCANNYLGLSSHPEVVAAAHEGLDHRGYGMSSVRFICGTQDIHRELEQQAHGVPRHRGHAALPLLHGRQRRRLRGAASASRT